MSAETCVECWAEPCACSRPAPAPLPVTNIQAKRNAQWLEGAEHGRKAERDRILNLLAERPDDQNASESRRFVAEIIAEIERSP